MAMRAVRIANRVVGVGIKDRSQSLIHPFPKPSPFVFPNFKALDTFDTFDTFWPHLSVFCYA